MIIITNSDDRYLFVKRHRSKPAGGYWCPVSGRLEPGESQEAAVVREAYEEVGLNVRPISKLGQMPCSTGEFMLHWWSAELISGEARVVAADELEELRWAHPSQFDDLQPAFREDIDFIRDFHASRRP